MIAALLTSVLDYIWWIETGISSILLFGEYPPPNEEDFE